MRSPLRVLSALLGLALAAALPASGSLPIKIKENKPGLMSKAVFPVEKAFKLAQQQFPAGTISEGEIEEENGKLIYSFDVLVPGKTGNDEVNIDAVTGELIAAGHEEEASAEPVYKLDHRVPMPGDMGWDFLSVDAPARRLYLSRGQLVVNVEANTEKI